MLFCVNPGGFLDYYFWVLMYGLYVGEYLLFFSPTGLIFYSCGWGAVDLVCYVFWGKWKKTIFECRDT